MDAKHSTNGDSNVMWYLDSNSDDEGIQDESKDSACASRPWRSYWPPKCKKMTEMWLRSEFPEVLSWRFDRTRPFDRPWRTWNRSARAVTEHSMGFQSALLVERYRQIKVSHDKSLLRVTSTSSLQLRDNGIPDVVDGVKFDCVNSAIFYFLVPLDIYNTEKPYLSRLPSGTDLARTNIVTESQVLKVFNVSGHESEFALDRSGFQFAKCPIQVSHWTDDYIYSEYIPKIENWLLQYLNCTSVFTYAYSFRGRDLATTSANCTKKPFLRAHCDATAASCFKRLQLYFPDKAHDMMKSRVRFINVWRAISTPNQDCPLAFCDFRTVRQDDLVPADIIFPHYQDEAYEVVYHPGQRWFYKTGMQSDDIILFKLADNSPGAAPFCPHSAFMDPSAPQGTPSRVSIEVRCIIFD